MCGERAAMAGVKGGGEGGVGDDNTLMQKKKKGKQSRKICTLSRMGRVVGCM